jgi:tripeptide aminopeptidase
MKEDIVEKFKRYVQVNSESGNEKEFADLLIKELKSIGLTVLQDQLKEAHHSNTSNIIATLEGSGQDSIFLCAHMDTVKPGINIEPYEKAGNIYSKGDTILGADDKAGVAVIMSTLEKIIEEKTPHRRVEVIFTVHEEGSLYGSKALDYDLIQSKEGLVLDSSGEVGGIVIKAPSKEKISAEVIGKSSHAGIAPEKGINAIAVASEAISKMRLSNVDRETTANIGTMNGGDATNVVPDNVNVTGEVRSFKDKNRGKQIDHMKECIDESINKHKAEGKITTELLYKSYEISKKDSLVQEIIRSGEKAGIEMFTRDSKGGSDANVFNSHGIKTVNLVIGTQNAHTMDEYIAIDSLIKCSKIIYNLLNTQKES